MDVTTTPFGAAEHCHTDNWAAEFAKKLFEAEKALREEADAADKSAWEAAIAEEATARGNGDGFLQAEITHNNAQISELKENIAEIQEDIGEADDLTTASDTLVGAINELNTKVTANTGTTDTGETITVDSVLSTSSENPVQNKVITKTIGELNNLETDTTDSVVAAINETYNTAFSKSGISTLNTIDKSSLVAAINELDANIDDKAYEGNTYTTPDLQAISNGKLIAIIYNNGFPVILRPTSAVTSVTLQYFENGSAVSTTVEKDLKAGYLYLIEKDTVTYGEGAEPEGYPLKFVAEIPPEPITVSDTGDITIDSALSETSTNPVANSAITAAINDAKITVLDAISDTSSNPVASSAIAAELDEINTKINELKYSTGDSGCYITITTTRYDNDDTTYGDVQYTINGKWTSGETFTLTTGQEEIKSDLGVRIWLFFEDYETVDYYLQWSGEDGTYTTYTEPEGYWLIHCIEMTDPTNSATETIEADTTYLTTTDVDAALSTTSENPVQNKVITAAINELKTSSGGTGDITVDTSITSDSTNPVTSAAIYTALEDKVDTTQYASVSQAGLIRLYGSGSTNKSGLAVTESTGAVYVATNSSKGTARTGTGEVTTAAATTDEIDAGENSYKPIVPSTLSYAVQSIGGTLTDLETTAQSSYVAAINELKAAQTTGGVTVDTALSDTSTNPVQNKVITAAIDDVSLSVSDALGLLGSETLTTTSGTVTGAINELKSAQTTGGVTVDTAITESSTNPVTSAAIYAELSDKIDSSEKGAASGVAPLNNSKKIASTYLNIDTTTSTTSMNPITNKAVTTAINDVSNTVSSFFDSNVYASVSEIASDIGIISDLETTATNLVDAVNEIKSSQSTGGVTVDSELSETSTNPVQNKVITAGINEVQSDVDDVSTALNAFCDSLTYVSVSEIAEAIDDVKESVQTAAAATGADKIYIDSYGKLTEGTSETAYAVPDEANAYELTDGAVFYLYDGSGVFKQQLVNETDITLNINDTGAKTVAINGQTFTEVNTAGSTLTAVTSYLYNNVLKLVYSSSSDMLELQPVADYLAGYVTYDGTTAQTISVTGYGDTLTDGRVIYAYFKKGTIVTTDTTLQVNKLTAKKLRLSQTRLEGDIDRLIRLTYSSEYDAFIAADDASYKESSKWNFTTAPAQIGTWIDGTPVWRMAWQKAFADMTTDDFDLLVGDKVISLPLSCTTGGTPFVLDSRCWLYNTSPCIIDDIPLTQTNGLNFDMTESDANRLDQESDGYFGYAIFVGEESEWTVN